MITDNDLEPFLNGSMGVVSLDLAREFVALRTQFVVLQQKCDGLQNTAIASQEAAAAAFGQVDFLKSTLQAVSESCANLAAHIMEQAK